METSGGAKMTQMLTLMLQIVKLLWLLLKMIFELRLICFSFLDAFASNHAVNRFLFVSGNNVKNILL